MKHRISRRAFLRGCTLLAASAAVGSLEIATEAFRRMGYAARFEPIDWEQKTNLVESGTIDCIWGCFSMDGREEIYRWAGPYMVSRQVVAVDADSSIRTLGDLAGKTVAVQSTGKPEEIFLSGSDPRIPQAVDVFRSLSRRGGCSSGSFSPPRRAILWSSASSKNRCWSPAWASPLQKMTAVGWTAS